MYVYIAAEDDFCKVVKIGISRDPSRRVRSFNTSWPGQKPLRPLHTFRCATREIALAVERSTLRRLRVSGIKVRDEKSVVRSAHSIWTCATSVGICEPSKL